MIQLIIFHSFFWLLVCFIVLIVAFKRVFIPRVNDLIRKRDETIEKSRESILKLETEIQNLEKKINEIKMSELKRSAEIINAATHKSTKILNEQLMILKDENEELLTGMRKRFKNDKASIDSTYKVQIDETVQAVFDRLFSSRKV